MSTHKTKYKHTIKLLIFILFIGITAFFVFLEQYYYDRAFPNTYLVGKNLGNLTKTDASNFISEKVTVPEKIKLTAKDQEFELVLSEIDFSYDLPQSVTNAVEHGKSQNS